MRRDDLLIVGVLREQAVLRVHGIQQILLLGPGKLSLGHGLPDPRVLDGEVVPPIIK